ncbi:Coiled-coil domain-containing protein C6orf97 [Atta colombica]|uniref:Coiled-coil domain-containing protein C6orf97 n=1 Tax=Atta colombica TaxID=520822 RepID=A0A195AZ51_9HYME|nr:Coiled-coil domain-containing protein C6orf97 [Atta colombica]
MTHDLMTTLRSELAALEYKRDRLMSELQEMKSTVRSRDQRVVELQVEADQLREQAARQNAVISSLKKRIQELEERERNLYASQGRNEITIQGLQRDVKYHEEKVREYDKKMRQLELNISEEIQLKERARLNLQDFVRRLAHALNVEYCETVHHSPEMVIHKAEELVQEVNRLRTKSTNVETQLTGVEVDFRTCRDALDRSITEKEQLQRQVSVQLVDIDRLRQEKECLEMQYRIAEKDMNDLRDKLVNANRSLTSATGNISNQEALICQLREDLKVREEKTQRVQNEFRHLLESVAILISTPSRFVESHENAIKDRIREILADNKDQLLKIQSLREKVNTATESTNRQSELVESTMMKVRSLEEERAAQEAKIHKLESELTSSDLSRESLRRDKQTFMTFLDRLGKAMQMDEISQEIGLDLQTESLLVRAEQLARLETDKLVDKLHFFLCRCHVANIFSFVLCFFIVQIVCTSVVYQLQRRVRTLREQLQRRDLHLDLLRRKLSLQEDSVRMKSLLQSERDEANIRAKKLGKQVDRLQIQLSDEKSRNRELSAQLTEAADYKKASLNRFFARERCEVAYVGKTKFPNKFSSQTARESLHNLQPSSRYFNSFFDIFCEQIAALERSRKIEELQKRLVESEMLRTRYNRKLTMAKEQMRTAAETADQERSINDHSLQLLRDEMAQVKQNLSEVTRRESQKSSHYFSVIYKYFVANLKHFDLLLKRQAPLAKLISIIPRRTVDARMNRAIVRVPISYKHDSIRKLVISCLSFRASASPWRSYCQSQSARPITRSFRDYRKWSRLIETLRCSPVDTTSLWKRVLRDAPGNNQIRANIIVFSII